MSLFNALLGGKQGWRLARYERRLKQINKLEPSLEGLTDGGITERVEALRALARSGRSLDELLVEAFALGREASRRTLGLRPYDVQLLGGMALHEGLAVEMKTGEGKTLAATLPAFLNSLAGDGVHIVTVNDYLAARDAEWMGPLYELLGVSVGVILEGMGADPMAELQARQAAYASDVTYGTNHEIAFDYLRDNLASEPEEVVHRGFSYAIVDEVDFLLIDEARTPLIISGPAREDQGFYERVDQVTRQLEEGLHYKVEAKTHSAALTEEGFEAVHQGLGVENLTDLQHLELYHAVHQSVLAHGAYKRDVDYIVEEDAVYIVDEYTGRVSLDKRYADGLHQAIEAKERVRVKDEDQTLAKVTYQTFYGRYGKLAGMTGTAWSERQELLQTYGCDVQRIPTHKPMIRSDFEDLIFNTTAHKHRAIVSEIQDLHTEGRPVLVGTTSVEESEQLSGLLQEASVPHEVLNAKNHRAEARIIAQAGRRGAVTISTNMAGRGTDIVLGGNPEMLDQDDPAQVETFAAAASREQKQIVAAGGLHVIGTAHHEAVRIDDQLRGRAGRQGDPGSSQFMISLDDELWKKFGVQAIAALRAELPDPAQGTPLESPRIKRTLRSLQKKVEVENQAIRKEVLKYDMVVHVQREAIYDWRRTLVTGEGFDGEELIQSLLEDLVDLHQDRALLAEALEAHFHGPFSWAEGNRDPFEEAMDFAMRVLREREARMGEALAAAVEIISASASDSDSDSGSDSGSETASETEAETEAEAEAETETEAETEAETETEAEAEAETETEAETEAETETEAEAATAAETETEAVTDSEAGAEALGELGRLILLQTIDELWTEHLASLERVEEGIGLRGYAQVDPVIEWRAEATRMWEELLSSIRSRAVNHWFLVELEEPE